MGIGVTCACGASYQLKDEYAGQQVRCPSCGQAMQVGSATAVAVIEGDEAFARDRFLLRQKALALNAKYYVWDEQGQTILFVERPAHNFRTLLALLGGIAAGVILFAGVFMLLTQAVKGDAQVVAGVVLGVLSFIACIAVAVALSPRRHITFYRDDTRRERLMEVLQINKWQVPSAYYDLRDLDGNVLARFKKNYLYNLIRRRWYVKRPDDAMWVLAKEDSVVLSLLRRVLPELISVFIRTNFIIIRPDDEQVIGEFNRKFTILDRYVLDMSADAEHHLDRRVALALGVLLDTGERR